jgi:hypothetical protein
MAGKKLRFGGDKIAVTLSKIGDRVGLNGDAMADLGAGLSKNERGKLFETIPDGHDKASLLKYTDSVDDIVPDNCTTANACGMNIPNVREAARRGVQVHNDWASKRLYGEGFTPEFRIIDPVTGKNYRIDALKFGTKDGQWGIKELKPNTPTGITKGQKQLDNYIEILERIYPESKGKWSKELVTYDS